MESFEDKINKFTDRNELVSHLKYLKDIGVISSVKTKGKPTFDLVMFFLESVESIEQESEIEKKIVFENQSLVLMYNNLAAKIEKHDIEKMTDNFQESLKKTKEIPNDVQIVNAYGKGELIQKQKIKKKKVTLEEFSEFVQKKRDMFGFKITSFQHKIIQFMLENKNKGEIKKILEVDNSAIRETLNLIDKEKFEIMEIGLKNEKKYKFIKL